MATIDIRGRQKNWWRKVQSVISTKLTKEFLGSTDGCTLVTLPPNTYIKDCYIRVITAVTGAASIDVGWGTAGNQISNDLSLAGAADSVASGAPSVPVNTGETGVNVTVKPNAAMTAGEFELVIELTEPNITSGDHLDFPIPKEF